MRTLVADGFFGRARELAEMAEYAELVLVAGHLARAGRRLRRILKISNKPPLMIFGPGGAGKSTLVAKFVLDYVDAAGARRFPFAYLSFDRPDLNIEQPLTLLEEAARQMAALFPSIDSTATSLTHEIRTTASALQASLDRRASQDSYAANQTRSATDEQILIERFAALVESATGKSDVTHV